MSQQALAVAAGMSRLALGKIERGAVQPRGATIEALAAALGVPVAHLVSPARSLSSVRFRARKQIQGRELILAEVADWLHGYAWLEQQLDDHPGSVLADLCSKSNVSRDPTRAASKAREALEIDDAPIRDICGLLEDNGVKVLRIRRATDAFFGMSIGPADGGPAVVINTWDRISVERWIFSAAHELGHLLLHLGRGSFERLETDEPRDEEIEADRFGGHFLMPPRTFDKEWEATGGHELLDRVLKVKRIFRVSYKTVLHRLVEDGRADTSVWQLFQRQHKRRFGKTLKRIEEPEALTESQFAWTSADEPERLSASDFIEDRLHRLVHKAVDSEVISMGRAAELLRLTRDEMRLLAKEWCG
jgi:Zn-dependent peptidase ImmA (M78 family)/DNA-binding XRE family transcriptional regulator